MKKSFILALFALIFISFGIQSCDTVHPNYEGVLMTNFGKNGKTDFQLVKGMVNTTAPGTRLYQVPLFEQRANFHDQTLKLKSSDNTEFTAKPLYSFEVIENRAIDVVFENARITDGENFIDALEKNVIEPHIYDLIKKESRRYSTDSLMATGGSLKFEQRVQEAVEKSFETQGLKLVTFSTNFDFSETVKKKIDNRNEVNTNISVIDQQIQEQRKKNELAALKAEENKILSSGLTEQVLRKEAIEGWVKNGCPTPQVVGANSSTLYNFAVNGTK